ncbi:hypothetical protein D9M73_229760 [compost metagenome]
MGLAGAEQAGDHRTEAVGRDTGNRQADFRASLAGRQGLGQVADDQQAAVAGLHLGQALGVFRQLIAAGGEQFGGDDLLAQG